ncbi:MAG: SMC-Scp complex subunit ScpB [Alphaproteobacteria bacterium]|nr:SMC-Scp complex subunit ScpB [Alphaproteobacteria bacterium]
MTQDRNQLLRLAEAIVFAAKEPVGEDTLAARLPEDCNVAELMEELKSLYQNRGVTLEKPGGKWAFRTAPDLAGKLDLERETARRLSRAGVETLAIIAYHQPVTRAEIEEIRGVAVSRGTLDVLLECEWIKPGRRRETPGRPLTWVTAPGFLNHFGLENLTDLPGLAELRGAGLLEKQMNLDVYTTRAETEDDQEDGDEENGDNGMDDLLAEALTDQDGEDNDGEPAIASADSHP